MSEEIGVFSPKIKDSVASFNLLNDPNYNKLYPPYLRPKSPVEEDKDKETHCPEFLSHPLFRPQIVQGKRIKVLPATDFESKYPEKAKKWRKLGEDDDTKKDDAKGTTVRLDKSEDLLDLPNGQNNQGDLDPFQDRSFADILGGDIDQIKPQQGDPFSSFPD